MLHCSSGGWNCSSPLCCLLHNAGSTSSPSSGSASPASSSSSPGPSSFSSPFSSSSSLPPSFFCAALACFCAFLRAFSAALCFSREGERAVCVYARACVRAFGVHTRRNDYCSNRILTLWGDAGSIPTYTHSSVIV